MRIPLMAYFSVYTTRTFCAVKDSIRPSVRPPCHGVKKITLSSMDKSRFRKSFILIYYSLNSQKPENIAIASFSTLTLTLHFAIIIIDKVKIDFIPNKNKNKK